MKQVRSPDCDCPSRILLQSGESGGEGGGTFNYSVANANPATAFFSFDAFTIKDAFQLYIDGYLNYNSGCALGTGAYSVALGTGVLHSFVVIVDGHCDPLDLGGTVWAFTLEVMEDRCF